jgi:DNA-binding LytR/AlgR family response regulator
MEKFSCIIVEDEKLASELLEDYIKDTPFLALKHTCSDALKALEILQKEHIEVIFLDINLPKLKGLDFIKTLKKAPQIIITTAHREFALDGYELNVVDYLLKPISFNRFLMAVNKLRTNGIIEPQMISFPQTERTYIFINNNKKKIKIYTDEILFIESKKEYISIVTLENTYQTKYQLTEIEEQLPKNKFIRTHRSFIVSLEKITAFSSTEVEINLLQIPIGRSYKEMVLSVLEL